MLLVSLILTVLGALRLRRRAEAAAAHQVAGRLAGEALR
jgi:hypothetical protein